MKTKPFLLASLVSLVSVQASAALLTDTVIHDFYSYGGGYSDNDRMIVNNPGSGDPFESIAFMKFDASGLASPVASAYLNLDMYCNAFLTCTGTSGDTTEFSVNLVGVDVASVTDSSSVAGLAATIGSAVDTIVIGAEDLYSWDITSLVNSWITDPSSNFGFAITARTDTDTDSVYNNYFTSSAADGNGALPSITTSPVPVPAAAWLFGSGLLGTAGVARRRTNA